MLLRQLFNNVNTDGLRLVALLHALEHEGERARTHLPAGAHLGGATCGKDELCQGGLTEHRAEVPEHPHTAGE